MTERRGRGRPPKDSTGTKRARVEFRAAESEKELLERAAKEDGESLSDWARAKLLKLAHGRLKDGR